jgi:N-acetylglucosaminyldiphosphoundecaprenol N-acetyl-beta-D-mannosaminyltransferase
VIREIDRSRADIVLVAFGAPKQELWIRDVLSSSKARVAIGVGGLFDFYSGRIPRAPLWVREMGLEWTYRLYQEPRRLWRRYVIGNATFLFRVILYRLRHGRDHSFLPTPPKFEVES